MRAPLDDPLMAEFVAALDRINALADTSPGFVWRLQTEAGNATAIRAFEDPLVLFNMSVWESIEALKDYVYRSDHVRFLRDRRKWFLPAAEARMVLWWIADGHRPSIEEGKERLGILRSRGPSPDAFTFKEWFEAPGEPKPAARPPFDTCEWAT